jgi:hypothetical protein
LEQAENKYQDLLERHNRRRDQDLDERELVHEIGAKDRAMELVIEVIKMRDAENMELEERMEKMEIKHQEEIGKKKKEVDMLRW